MSSPTNDHATHDDLTDEDTKEGKMNQSTTISLLAQAHRADVQAQGDHLRLERQVRGARGAQGAQHVSPIMPVHHIHRRLATAIASVLLALGLVAGVALANDAPAATGTGGGGCGGGHAVTLAC